MRAGEQAAGLRRVNALAGGALVEQAVDHVDLVLQRLERLQRLAELHLGARALGAPVILVDAVAHEQHARSASGTAPATCGVGESGKRLEPRQRHGDSGAAKNGAAGNAIGGFLRSIRASYSPFCCGGIRASFVQELRAGDDGLHQGVKR